MKVSLFVTCLADSFYPRTAIAAVKLLEHLGCEVDFPRAQTCCGQPMFNTGYRDDARELAKRMITAFEQSETVISPSGSCTAMIHDYYPELFEGDHAWEHAAEQFVEKTHEFVDFLIEKLNFDPAEHHVQWDGEVTYHYSCHLRGIGIPGGGDKIVKFMNRIEGLRLTQLDKAEQCCGFGGTFAIKYPQVSGTMVRDKVEQIKKTGAPICISNDAGCTMNISGACNREKLDVRFISLAEILAEGLGLLEKTNNPASTLKA